MAKFGRPGLAAIPATRMAALSFHARRADGAHKTGQLVCYLTRTTRVLATSEKVLLAAPRPWRYKPALVGAWRSPVSALVWGTRGREFKSRRSDHLVCRYCDDRGRFGDWRWPYRRLFAHRPSVGSLSRVRSSGVTIPVFSAFARSLPVELRSAVALPRHPAKHNRGDLKGPQ